MTGGRAHFQRGGFAPFRSSYPSQSAGPEAADNGTGRCVIVATARDAAELFRSCFAEGDAETETLAAAYLDEGRRLIEVAVVPVEAGAAHVELPVRRILEDALRLGAKGILIAHNHPSGDAQPSREDIESTRELAETAARLGMRLHDHLIFAGEETASLRSMGLL
jgi:DNA repair protein RadC